MVALSSSRLYTFEKYYLDLMIEAKREVLVVRGQILQKYDASKLDNFSVMFKHQNSGLEYIVQLDHNGAFIARLNRVGEYLIHLKHETDTNLCSFTY